MHAEVSRVHMRRVAGWLLPVIAVVVTVAVLVGFAHDRTEAQHPVPVIQSAIVWQARQQQLWQSVDVVRRAELAEQQRLLDASQAEESADIAAISEGNQDAMVRQSSREDKLIRSVIANCDPAVVMQLKAVEELAWPLSGAMKITSPYGDRIHPIIGEEAFHRGVDLRAHYGSPVLAPADGVVLFTSRETTYGNMIVVLHGGGIATVYGHMWKFAVQPYERVQKGQLLGYTGNTGFSTGPHLHFEVRQNGEPTNPLEWLPPIETTDTGAIIQ
jgi:murein DD-endopeptidase MepM/ murein hydrolase activator NlpD